MALSRKGPPKRKKSYKKPTDIEIANRRAFHEEAWRQRCCAMCGKTGAYQSHHVVEKQKLRIEGRLDVKWDIRNCLRLCDSCHSAHTGGWRRVTLDRLTDLNYEFAWDILGMASAQYLRDRYNGTDDRWKALDAKCDEALEAARAAADSTMLGQ